jgi:hypothetical protein
LTNPDEHAFAEVTTRPNGNTMFRIFTLERGEIWAVRVPVATKKSAIRFCVGEPGNRSTVWRIWPSPPHNDVYLATRESAGLQKFSLHESGDYRLAWLDNSRRGTIHTSLASDDSRVLMRWERPARLPNGWLPAVSIFVPREDVVEIDDEVKWQDVQWLPQPPEGHCAEIEVSLVQPDLGPMVLPRGDWPTVWSIMNTFRLPNGETVVVSAVTREMSGGLRSSIGRVKRRWHAPETFSTDPELGPRIAAMDTTDGRLRILDLAVPERPIK